MNAGRPPGLLTFGETMGLIAADGVGTLGFARGFTFGIGGAESNVAIGVSRLGSPATWIGRVGRDATGDLVEHRLRAYGVDTVAVRDPAFTGLMVRHRRSGSAVQVDYHRTGSAGSRLTPADLPVRRILGAAILHVTGITPALSETARSTVFHAVEAARAAGVTVSFDVNYRSKLWNHDTARPVLRDIATRADIVFAGIDEARLVLAAGGDPVSGGDPAELAAGLAALGPREVVVTAGARGATALIDGVLYAQPPVPVTVVDPVGAGDAFVAGYLAEHLTGAGPALRMRTAAANGAYAVTVPGDCELLPTRAELRSQVSAEDVMR